MSSPFIPARVQHLARYREIAAILAHHGWGWLVLQLGLRELLPRHIGPRAQPVREGPPTQAAHLRLAFEELGVTFVKLGQILSTRSDLLSPAYIAELSKLQDAAPPIALAQVADVIERELGAPPERVFAEFEPTPRASASIGQVHGARLQDGAQVVVKVQRPHVEADVERDLAVLADLAGLAARHSPWGQFYDPVALVEEFAYTLRNELDYTREGQNADRIRHNFAGDPALCVPKVYWEYSARRVLTMEAIHGIKINDLAALDAAGFDRRRVAEQCVRIMLTEVFEHGFFHADPHAGNFFVMARSAAPAATALRAGSCPAVSADEVVIGLMDYGMVGRLDDPLRESVLRIVLQLAQHDSERLVDELLALGLTRGRIQRPAFRRDLDHLIDTYYDRSLQEMLAEHVLGDLMGLALRHHIQFPSDLMLLLKVVAMSEGLGARLDPAFKLLVFAEPYFKQFWYLGHGPRALAAKLARGTLDSMDVLPALPYRLARLLGELERGELRLTAHHEGLAEGVRELERVANRVTMGLITAALIVGSAVAVTYYHPPGWEAVGGFIFTVTFVMATLFAARLLWIIWRTGRR